MIENLELLGKKVRDKVTRCEGIVTSVGFDLYGCVQGLVNPGMAGDRKMLELLWFDVARLEVIDPCPVMTPPKYVESKKKIVDKGPESKPTASNH